MLKKTLAPIAIFYGSSTCYTEMASEKIAAEIGEERVDIYNIANEPIATASLYKNIIMGIPTWDYGELQEDWEEVWPELDKLNLEGKKIALFGLGDQLGYPEWFLDSMGYLHDKLITRNATIIGYWPNTGFNFTSSKALTEDKTLFVGLALDDENEFDKTPERIRIWCEKILPEFNLTN